MKGRIVILGGGTSAEREISIKSAKAAYKALKPNHPEIALATIEADGELPADLDPSNDILFLTTHGTFGEDGHLQAQLDRLGFIYTGTGAQGSQICFAKARTKKLAQTQNVDTPDGLLFHDTPQPAVLYKILGPKLILKPEAEGSSLGIHVVESAQALAELLPELPHKPYLAERFVEGRELTCGWLNGEALSVVEICPKDGIYDFNNKYGKNKTDYIAPAKLTAMQTNQVKSATSRICKAAAVADFARVDFRLGTDGKLYFLEVNTLPGLTPNSLLPKSAAASNMSFEALLENMLQGARNRFATKYAMVFA